MIRTVRRRRWVMVVALTLAVNAVGTQPTTAAFPGLNGKIAFTTYRDTNAEVYVMNADGSGQTNLTSNSAGDVEPAWSPDGQRIAFTTDRDNFVPEVYVMNADGSGQTNRTSNSARDVEPDWQPTFSADLVLGLATSPNTAKRNSPLTYMITVANQGPTGSSGVVVTSVLPASSRFVSVVPSSGTCTAPPAGSTGTVTCSLGALASGQSAVTTITVTIVVKKATVTGTASVTSATPDPNPANNSASVSVQAK